MDESKIVDFNAFREQRIAQAKKEAAEAGNEPKKSRVSSGDFFLFVFTFALFDGLQALLSLIPFVGWVLSAAVGGGAWFTDWLWSRGKGWNLSGKEKEMLIKYVIPVVELVPILNILPTWSLRAFLKLSVIKAEDALRATSGGAAGIEKLASVSKKAA